MKALRSLIRQRKEEIVRPLGSVQRQGIFFVVGFVLSRFARELVVAQAGLRLAQVPVQNVGERFEPIAQLIKTADGRHRVDAGGNSHTANSPAERLRAMLSSSSPVLLLQLVAISSIYG